MSDFDMFKDQYEEDQLNAYYDAYCEAESLDIAILCRGINIRKVDANFRDMVKNIKEKAKTGIKLSEKQLKVLLRAWAYQHIDVETSTAVRDCSECDLY